MNIGLMIGIGIGFVLLFLILFVIFVATSGAKDYEKMLTKYGNAAVRAQNNIVKNNEDILKETANKTADINKEAVKTIAHSIKEGFTNDNSFYCKHCGEQVDADSKFCKKCGKQL